MNLNLIVFLFSFIFSLNLFANQFQGKFSLSQGFSWHSSGASASDQGVTFPSSTPKYSALSLRLPSAEKIILANLSPISKINLVSSRSGSSVNLTINAYSISFGLNGNVLGLDDSGHSAKSDLSGNTFTVYGKGYADKVIVFPELRKRPVESYQIHFGFMESKKEIEDAFSVNPSGVYRGQAVFPTTFILQDGERRFTQNLTLIVDIEIDYDSSSMSSIIVNGSDKMNTVISGGLVSGSTKYSVIADGELKDGLMLSVIDSGSEDGRFYLHRSGKGKVTDNKIPFSVYCGECEKKQQLIDRSGRLVVGNGESVSAPSSFSLDVSFDNADLSKSYGFYNGNFTIILEPMM